jgi:hypothetical protein
MNCSAVCPLHVFSLAVLGCLALALTSGRGLWAYIGLLGAVIVSLRAGVELYRDLQRQQRL